MAVSQPFGLARGEQRQHLRALARVERRADLRVRAIELEAELGHAKVHAIGTVGSSALTAQSLLSGRGRLLVEAEPSAVHGIAHISQKITFALGEIVDETVRQVTR